MKRLVFTIAGFLLCLVVFIGAMSWVSLTALRLEKGQQAAQQRAAMEEKVRLALWRMDSALTPLVARESARPYFVYTAFYPAERSYTRMFAEIRRGDVLLPSPLLTEESPYILLHFQIGADGHISSPRAPTGNMRDLAEMGYVRPDRLADATDKLKNLSEILNHTDFLETILAKTKPQTPPAAQSEEVLQVISRQQGPAQQIARNYIEVRARYYNNSDNNALLKSNSNDSLRGFADSDLLAYDPMSGPLELDEGVIRPLWIGDSLLLVRRVTVRNTEYVQGCWLDWPALRNRLLDNVRDLLPNADIAPAVAGKGGDQPRQSRMLTALPVLLIPGQIPVNLPNRLSPISISLIMAWVCVLVAIIAVGVLLFGALSLSERRGAFVSAVTHELRTPLTTFRMYAEMLAGGMIPEPKRQHYLSTLRTEADRLSHLVENVLSFAQLENRRPRRHLENISVQDVIERCRDRLSDRAEQAGMHFTVEENDTWRDMHFRADVGVVEQVLFNLVDNACKYASGDEDKRLHFEARTAGNQVEMRIRDHGPGVSRAEIRKLFRPFRKSARDAANSAPGVGLGLALCRRLARGMGGRLVLDESVTDGACFVFSLPRA